MAKVLNNEEIKSVLDMPACIDALYAGFKAYYRGDAARRPRIDLFAPTSRADEFACFSSMEGIIKNSYYAIRIKPEIISWPEIDGRRRRVTYTDRPGYRGGLILLFSAENGRLLAIMSDDYIQHMRAGATAALGAKYLAVSNAETVGILGSGAMARAFAWGFAAVRRLTGIKAYSPNREHLRSYCREMSEKLAVEVSPMKSAREAVQGSDIVASCTNSLSPVIEGRWLTPGMYVSNISVRELDQEALGKITLVGYLTFNKNPLNAAGFSDHNFELLNAMAYLTGQPEERRRMAMRRGREIVMSNARWVPCVDWNTETGLGTNSDREISLLAELAGSNLPGGLSSSGVQGLQCAAVAGRVYELASSRDVGGSFDSRILLQKSRG